MLKLSYGQNPPKLAGDFGLGWSAPVVIQLVRLVSSGEAQCLSNCMWGMQGILVWDSGGMLGCAYLPCVEAHDIHYHVIAFSESNQWGSTSFEKRAVTS